MSVNASQVLIGSPDQATTGAILSAPLGTTLPTSATDALDGAFVDSGFVSEDGLTLAPGVSTADIREWGGALVRRILQSFDGTLSWAMLETNEASLRAAFGDDYVSVVAASAAHGKQITARLGAHLPAAKSWVFRMKDGDNRILIVVPNGQITTVNDVSFTSSDAIAWSVELSCYPDATGESIYIMTDDGASASPEPGPEPEPTEGPQFYVGSQLIPEDEEPTITLSAGTTEIGFRWTDGESATYQLGNSAPVNMSPAPAGFTATVDLSGLTPGEALACGSVAVIGNDDYARLFNLIIEA